MIHLLHVALLILRCEQRQDRRHLVGPPDDPLRWLREFLRQRSSRAAFSTAAEHKIQVAGIAAVPVGQCVLGVLGRSTTHLCFCEQRFVVFTRRLERVRTDDCFAWVVALAVTPGCRLRVVVVERPGAARIVAPDRVEGDRAVAAVVPLVHPEVAIGVEVLRGEDVARQRLDAVRRLPAGGRRAGRVVPRRHSADEVVSRVTGEWFERHGYRPPASHAFLRPRCLRGLRCRRS